MVQSDLVLPHYKSLLAGGDDAPAVRRTRLDAWTCRAPARTRELPGIEIWSRRVPRPELPDYLLARHTTRTPATPTLRDADD